MSNFIHTIKFKIILALGVSALLIASIGLFCITGLSKMNASINESYSGNMLPVVQLSDVRSAQMDIQLQLRKSQVKRDPAEIAAALEQIHSDENHQDASWKKYYPDGISSAKERVIADKINDVLPQYKTLTDKAILAFKAEDFDAAAVAIDMLVSFSNSHREFLEQDISLNLEQAKQFVDDSEASFRSLLWIAVGLVCAGIVVAMGMSVYLLRTISKPLEKAVSVANHIAVGKLENGIQVDSQDEFGQLISALQKMDGQLSATVRGIKLSTESVAVASKEIAEGNADLSSRTEEQAASLEQTASSMVQLTETVKQNADNARQANTLATRASSMVDTGNDVVQTMVTTIGHISQSSAKIADITGLIEGIAFQTNILALNAAVEAARAGDQGRGFAVVASEVRSLAQRSSAAAKEIKELIESSVLLVQSGSKQAGEVGVTMGDVKQAIQQVSDIVGEIASASEEQSRGIEQVNQAITQMDQVTQQNAALVEEAAAAAESLEEQATKLAEAVAVFQIADAGLPASRTVVVQNQPRQPALNADKMQRSGPAEKKTMAVVKMEKKVATSTEGDWETF